MSVQISLRGLDQLSGIRKTSDYEWELEADRSGIIKKTIALTVIAE